MTIPTARRPVAQGRLAFPTEPDPDWSDAQRARWEAARDVADTHPGSPGEGGWTVERLSTPVGAILALTVTIVGGLVSFAAVVAGVHPYVGLGGIVASG